MIDDIFTMRYFRVGRDLKVTQRNEMVLTWLKKLLTVYFRVNNFFESPRFKLIVTSFPHSPTTFEPWISFSCSRVNKRVGNSSIKQFFWHSRSLFVLIYNSYSCFISPKRERTLQKGFHEDEKFCLFQTLLGGSEKS